jgi:SpoVK/Ycf46/Vps4 family AAA+-type ATPase
VGHTEQKLAEIFSAARELSPCILLLDNLDMILGSSSSSGGEGKGNGGSGRGSSAGASGGKRFSRNRTRNHAVDRMLSTLLVEIDGIHTSASPFFSSVPISDFFTSQEGRHSALNTVRAGVAIICFISLSYAIELLYFVPSIVGFFPGSKFWSSCCSNDMQYVMFG